MLTPEQIAALQDAAGRLTDPVSDFLIEDIARRVSEAGQLTGTAAYQAWRAQQLGVSRRTLKKELQKRLNVSGKELRQLMTQAAEVGYRFDLKRLPHGNAVPFARNGALQQIVSAAVELAQDDFSNLVQTLGFIAPDGKSYPLTEAYQKTCDFAFQQVAMGAADYHTAVRRAVRQLTDHGIQTIDYETGASASLEAAVRRNVMGGLGLLQEQIGQHNFEELGANGWEITAHAGSAPDHEPVQGKQFSDLEFRALNNSLKRRIGTLNCGHMAFPIVRGVNAPQYTDEELEAFREENERGVTYEGRHYTGYEATQVQRRLEGRIRRQKRRVAASEAAGDAEQLAIDKARLTRLNQEYARFSKAAGLRTERERTWVQVAKLPQHDIIKNIDLDDMQTMAYGKDIDESVIQTIYDVIEPGERNGEYYINEVFIGSLPRNGSGTPLLQIEPIPAKGAALLRLNVNSDVLAGKSLEEVDMLIAKSERTIAQSLEEAAIHETGHAKLIFGQAMSDIENLYDELAEKGITGISKIAAIDGAEAIAEIEVLLHRGDKLSDTALDLYKHYMEGELS